MGPAGTSALCAAASEALLELADQGPEGTSFFPIKSGMNLVFHCYFIGHLIARVRLVIFHEYPSHNVLEDLQARKQLPLKARLSGFSARYGARLSWLLRYTTHVDPAVREHAAKMIGIAISVGPGLDAAESVISDLVSKLKAESKPLR